MIEIQYRINEKTGSIFWAAAEEFNELRGQQFSLGKMEAKEIATIDGLSDVAKILLSAVAGAVIQHVMDEGAKPEEIFTNGTFEIK